MTKKNYWHYRDTKTFFDYKYKHDSASASRLSDWNRNAQSSSSSILIKGDPLKNSFVNESQLKDYLSRNLTISGQLLDIWYPYLDVDRLLFATTHHIVFSSAVKKNHVNNSATVNISCNNNNELMLVESTEYSDTNGNHVAKTTATYTLKEDGTYTYEVEIDCTNRRFAAIFDKRTLIEKIKGYIDNLIKDWKDYLQKSNSSPKP